MGTSEILDMIDLAVRLIAKLQEAWKAQGLDADAFDAAVKVANTRIRAQAKTDADVELAGAGGAGA